MTNKLLMKPDRNRSVRKIVQVTNQARLKMGCSVCIPFLWNPRKQTILSLHKWTVTIDEPRGQETSLS